MDRKHLTIKYGSFIYLSCDDGYISAAGLEGESLFIRDKTETNIDEEVLPLLGFETSVFQVEPPMLMASTKLNLSSESANNNHMITEHHSKINTAPELTFGQAFLLVHTVSQMHVAVFPSRPSQNDPDCVKIVLVRPGEVEPAFCEFVFLSRYKIHDDGDTVCRGDKILLRLATYPIFIHVTASAIKAIKNSALKNTSGESHSANELCSVASVNNKIQRRNGFPVACDEVNGSEEMSVTFVVQQYDIGRDQANYQRSLHQISRPYVPSGIPVAFYHRELEGLLTTSFTLPPRQQRKQQEEVERALGGGGRGELDIDDGNDIHGASLVTRRYHSAVEGIITSNGAMNVKSGDSTTYGTEHDGDEDEDEDEDVIDDDGAPYPLFKKEGVSAGAALSEEKSLDDVQCSCTALWILENEDPTVGGAVRMQTARYRLRQACSNLYLAVVGSGVDAFFEDDGNGEILDAIDHYPMVESKGSTNSGNTDQNNLKTTKLCMIPPPRSQKDLERTLFCVKYMFASECSFLIENECVVLQNVLTEMYVCTQEKGRRLSLGWQPSAHDAIVVRKTLPDIGKNLLFLWVQCERLCTYRDAFQALALEKLQKQLETEQKEEQMEIQQEELIPTKDVDNSEGNLLGQSSSLYLQNDDQQMDVQKSCPQRKNDSDETPYSSIILIVIMCQNILVELIRFCSVTRERDVLRLDGIPIVQNQRMMFDMNIHRLILDIILAPFLRFTSDAVRNGNVEQMTWVSQWKHKHWGCNSQLPMPPLRGGVICIDDLKRDMHSEVHLVCRLAFRLLRQMVRKAPILKVGLDAYIPFLLGFEGRRLRVVDTLTEILTDNPNIATPAVERIVDYFIDSLHHTRKAKYLELFASMCTVGRRGISERQAMMCQRLLVDHSKTLPYFELDCKGEWAIGLCKNACSVSYDVFFDLKEGKQGADIELVKFVQSMINLLSRLCFDGCPSTCYEEVAKIFPPKVLLRAIQTFVWTGNEVVGRRNSSDLLRGYVLRLALQCYILPRIDDPAVKLRATTVLFGSSLLRKVENSKLPLSGNPDDDLIREVKLATLNIICANPYFVQSDIYRTKLLRASLDAWYYFVIAHQVTVDEVGSLILPLLSLMDGGKDIINDDISRVAEHTRTRLEVSEASVQMMKAREVICITLLKLLEGAVHRAADEIILFLYNAFANNTSSLLPRKNHETGTVNTFSLYPKVALEAAWPSEKQALLQGGDVDSAGRSRCGYQAVETDSEMQDMNVYSVDPKIVVGYLKCVCNSIKQQFCVDKIIPRIMDITRYDSPQLKARAMELLVRLCTIKRGVAHRVLQVHTLPSTEVTQHFDNFYTISVNIYTLRRRGCVDEAITLALTNIEAMGLPHDVFASSSNSEMKNKEGERSINDSDSQDDGSERKETDPAHVEEENLKKHCLWGKPIGAARMLSYGSEIRRLRSLVGLGDSSKISLRFVIRMEMVCHWRIHITLLEMYSSIDPGSLTFFKWMRFFYLFTLSRSNAKRLRQHIDLFLHSITLNEKCKAMCVHIVLAILSTVANPSRWLTTIFLKGCVEYLCSEIALDHFDSNFLLQLSNNVFAKPAVSGIARRRMMQLLWDYDLLRCLPQPGSDAVPLRSKFIASLVEFLCCVCSSSTSSLVMGQRALPMSNILAIIFEYGSQYSPLLDLPHMSIDVVENAFRLIDTYLCAIVSLYFTAFKEEGGQGKELRKIAWMKNSELWAVLKLLTDQLRELSELISKDKGNVMNRGLVVLQKYRQVWLGSVPITLLAFFSECFFEAGFYRYQHVIGFTFNHMCDSIVCFSSDLLTYSKAIALEDHEAVYYRRLLGVIHMHVSEILGLDNLAKKLNLARNKMIIWQVEYDRAKKAEQEQRHHIHDTGEGQTQHDNLHEYEDNQDNVLAGEDMLQGLQDSLALSFFSGLSLSSATTQRRDLEAIRNVLKRFVGGDVLISVEDSVDSMEVANIVNILLRRSPEELGIRDFIGNVLDGMQKCYFSSMTLVGLMNFFYNALYTTIYEDEQQVQYGKGVDVVKKKQDNLYTLQLTLSDLGMSQVVASLCALDDDVLTYSTIRVGVMLLEGGNQQAQNAFLDYFETRQEGFFYNIRDVMQKSLQWVQRVNMQQCIVTMERGVKVISTPNAQKYTSALFTSVFASPSRRRGGGGGKKSQLSGWDSVQGCLRLRLLRALFRLLQLFCEGHNFRMQNYIRSQHDNMHNVNILYEVMLLVVELSTIIHPVSLEVLHGGFELLTELCQGPCYKNQEALLGYDVCTTICNLLDLLGRPEAIGIEVEQITTEKKLSKYNKESSFADINKNNEGCDMLICIRHLTRTDINCIIASITTCLLSLIEGCRSPEIFHRIFKHIPIEIIERQFSTITPEMCDHILEDEDFEDDPGVEALFKWLIFLNSVRPFAEGQYLQHIDELLRRTSRLNSRLGFIEVQRSDGLLERVFFHIPFICCGLTQRIKDSVLWSVDRTSRATKLGDFLHQSDNLIFEVERHHAFQRWVTQWTRFKLSGSYDILYNKDNDNEGERIKTENNNNKTKKKKKGLLFFLKKCWNQFIAPFLFSSQLSFYESVSVVLAVLINFGLIWAEGVKWSSDVLILWNYFFIYICFLQFIVSCVAFCVDAIVFFPVSLYREYRRKQHFTTGIATLNATMQEVCNGLSRREFIYLFFKQFNIQFRLFLIVMSIMSFLCSYYFAAAHLLLIIYKVSTLRTFITSITHNGKQLLLSAFLGIVVLYFFAITGYLYFPKKFNSDEGEEGENCDTLLRCFVFILWKGLRQGGGVGDIMQGESWTSSSIFLRISYDLLFFAFVNVVFLNIMFGLIIDTFGEQRDEKREKELNIKGTCFVCGLEADVFEKTRVGGFRDHVLKEHNLWMYLYFMHYLRRKNLNDFTGQESYVYEKIQQNDLAFFPEGNSIYIQESKKGKEMNNDDDDNDHHHMEHDSEERNIRQTRKDKKQILNNNCVTNTEAITKTLKELVGMKEALGIFLRDINADAQKIKSMIQQLELTTRSARGTSLTGGTQHGRLSLDDAYVGRQAPSLSSQTRRSGKGK